MFFEQTQIFQEGLSKRHVFQGGSICSSNRPYYLIEQILIYPRNPYLVLEHIHIFQEPLFFHRTDTHFPGSLSPQTPMIFQETISSPRTHTIFSKRSLCLEHIDIFQESTSSRTDISLIRSRWLLSKYKSLYIFVFFVLLCYDKISVISVCNVKV